MKIKIPEDYVAIPRNTYDAICYANHDYNKMFADVQKLLIRKRNEQNEKGYLGFVSLEEIAELLGIKLPAVIEKRKGEQDVREDLSNKEQTEEE